MSTRGSYTFVDELGSYNVYVHSDNYPSGAAKKLQATLEFAWDLPRFEADEFAAAFVAASKESCQGGVRLLPTGGWKDVSPDDVEYHYSITINDQGFLLIECTDVYEDKVIFHGTLDKFVKWANKEAWAQILRLSIWGNK